MKFRTWSLLELVGIIGIIFLLNISGYYFLLFFIIFYMEHIKFKKLDNGGKEAYRKSSIHSLYIIMSIAVVSVSLQIDIKPVFLEIFILIPLIYINLYRTFYLRGRDILIKRTGYTITLLLFLFTFSSHGFSIPQEYILPGALLLATIIAIKSKILGFFSYFFLSMGLFYIYLLGGDLNYQKIYMLSLLTTPILFLAIASLKD
ncbi:MAG: hypothetical protein ACQESN_09025 [Thermotogota bacterium]